MFTNKDYNVSILYIRGKGEEFFGNLELSNGEELTFDDIYQTWIKRSKNMLFLYIIADMDYSGRWIKELKVRLGQY